MLEITQSMFEATYNYELERIARENPEDEKMVEHAIESTCRKLKLVGERRMEMVAVFRQGRHKRFTMLVGVVRSRRHRPHWQEERENLTEENTRDIPLPPLTGGH